MERFIRIVPPNGAVEIFGVKLVGVTAENGMKLLFSLAFVVLTLLLGWRAPVADRALAPGASGRAGRLLARQAIHLSRPSCC